MQALPVAQSIFYMYFEAKFNEIELKTKKNLTLLI